MSQDARRAGRRLARVIARHSHDTAERAVERRANDIGEVTKSDGKGSIEVWLPGVALSVNESDLYCVVDPATLEVDDEVAMMAVDNEWVLIGKIIA